MKIVLLGYMACGKSFISNELAKELKLKHIDLDTYIATKENSSIVDIFSSKGEIYFRKMEAKYLKEILLLKENIIFSIGGGTPCYGNNMELIKKHALSFYLKANPTILYNQLKLEKKKRPLVALIKDVNLEEFIGKHLFERNSYYLQANFNIEVDLATMSSVKIINRIIKKINLYKQ